MEVEEGAEEKPPEQLLIEEHQRLLAYDGPDRIVSADQVYRRWQKETTKKFVARSGIPAFDAALKGGFYPGQLIVISGKTGEGKTSLCRTFTHAFACQGLNPLWFSYEEVAEEFLAKFPEKTLQLFYMPNELTGKTTAWVQERVYEGRIKHGCNVVFVDHLHFLVDLYRSRNASLEIGAVVRDLKRLALKHRVAFFLICHIGKIEKKRELESGDTRDCLPAGQRLYTMDGLNVPVEEIVVGSRVLSRRSMTRLQEDVVTGVWPAGPKTILRVETETGRSLECSTNHKLFALTHSAKGTRSFGPGQGTGILGWTEASKIEVGQKIACVKEYPGTIPRASLTLEQALLLGWIVGDGHINRQYGVEITVATQREIKIIEQTAQEAFGLLCKATPYKTKKATRLYVTNGRGIHGPRRDNALSRFFRERHYCPVGTDKCVPEDIFKQPPQVVASFLSGLFQADGSISMSGKNKSMAVITLSTISQRLAKEVKHLLLRVGIVGRLRRQGLRSSGFRTRNGAIYTINIYGQGVVKFRESIGFLAEKRERMTRLLVDWHPKALKSSSYICFERVKSVQPIGVANTFDISVRGHHASLKNNSFCVEDIITHNSSLIEQEADTVIMCWRKPKAVDITQAKITKNRKGGKVSVLVDLPFNEASGLYDCGQPTEE